MSSLHIFNYQRELMKHLLLLLTLLSSTHLVAGGLDREIYTDILGNNLSALKNSPKFLVAPDFFDVVPEYESPKSYGNNYGALLRGYLTIPEDGDYVFYLASDDQGELYLSTDNSETNKQLIASISRWSGYRQFDKYESQKSVTLSLIAGQVLYTEALVKEGGGGDNLSVAWSINGGPIEVIPGDYLTPYFNDTEKFKTELAVSLAAATSLYEESALTIGTEVGQYSEASRLNFATSLATLQAVHDNELSDSRVFYSANIQTLAAINFFAGGVKPVKLTGEVFGATPTYALDRLPAKAFDGDIGSYYQYFAPDGGYVGIDLGAGNETALTSVRYHPRAGKLNYLKNNKFQGSIDGILYTDIYTITDEGADEWTTVEVTDTTAYRYYRYLDVAGSNDWGIIGEVEFYGLAVQELHMQKHEILTLAGETENQIITSEKLTATHGGLLPQFITYEILTLPTKGSLALGAAPVFLGTTFTQEDLNNNLVTYSSDASRLADNFSVKVSDSIGGLLEEVIVDIDIDTDGDGLSDLQEISFGTDYTKADTDGDGLSDSWELDNSMDPVTSEVSTDITSINGENGLTASYNYGAFNSVTDFSSRSPTKVEKISAINFPVYYWSEFSNSGAKDYVGAKFTGYLYVPVEGNYKFALTSDDGSRLYIDGIQIIDNDGLHGAVRLENTINLSAGFHKIRCEYFEKRGSQVCVLQWQGPSRPMEVIPAAFYFLSLDEHQAEIESIDTDQDGLVDSLEAQEGTDPLNPDSDGDRLLDGEEYHAMYDYKTNPLSVDTDGDTVSDYDEIFIFLSNPLVPDFDGTMLDTITIIPKDTSARLGQWQEEGNEILAMTRRGAVEYKFTVTAPSFYKLDSLIAQGATESKHSLMDLHVYIDGEYIDRQKTDVAAGPVNVSWLTTYMKAGEHTLKIFWENVYFSTSLKISELKLSRPGGPDNDLNGRPDWIDTYLKNSYSLDEYKSISQVSPAQIEGKGRYISKMSISTGDKVQRGIQNRWFIDLQLSKEGPTSFNLEYEEGLDSKSGLITWQETNVLEEDDMTIRQGSTLLLNAVIDGDTDPIVTIKVGESDVVSVAPGEPLEYKFENSGTYEIVADYQGSESRTETLLVNVIGVEETDAPFIWRNKSRFWNWPNLPDEVTLYAEGIEMKATTDGYTLKRSEVLEEINIIARLGSNGPIIESLPTKAFWLRDVVEGSVLVVEQFDDGTKITKDTVFGPQIPEGMIINVNTISGVTFSNGSRIKNITKDDFDELDQWTIELYKTVDRTGASCHWYKVYQNGVFVGQQNK
jgi:hypothetical protein